MTWTLSILAIVLSYLIGSIPFGFLTAKWVKGLDIRTVGSGNIGATNVGRALGFRWFLFVFAFDFAKGLAPAAGFPATIRALSGSPDSLAVVMIAAAAIVGHTFPVYLGFKGGKGVATSLGAMTALDPAAAGVAAMAFALFLVITSYVSLSALLGATGYVLAHCLSVDRPFSGSHAPLSFASLAIVALLFVLHRGNLVRIMKGTEPKVRFGKKSKPTDARSGKILAPALCVLGTLCVATTAVLSTRSPSALRIGSVAIRTVDRASTKHQRAERVEFSEDGTRLAATCPRYNRFVFWKMSSKGELGEFHDVGVGGRAVAVRSLGANWIVLVRPSMDARHLEPAWWQVYDFAGKPLGDRFVVGYDPDDFVILPEASAALILLSGNAEGERQRHSPRLVAVDLSMGVENPSILSTLDFLEAGDDPDRLAVSCNGARAAVSFRGSHRCAIVDIANLRGLEEVRSVVLPEKALPGELAFTREGGLLVSDASQGKLWAIGEESLDAIDLPGPMEGLGLPFGSGLNSVLAVGTLVKTSELAFVDSANRCMLGSFPLRGTAGLAKIRPAGLAYCAARRLMAVANSSGGSVHVLELD